MEFSGTATFLIGLIGGLIVLGVLIGTSRKKLTIKDMTTISIAVAMSYVLSLIKLFEMPQGGSVTLASMLPIIIISMIYGKNIGFLSGIIYGFLNLMVGGYVIHPVQLILDYPLAFMCIGFASIFHGKYDMKSKIGAVLVAFFTRFICHFISGVVFFASSAKDQNVFLYSAIYNGGFLAVEMAIALVIIAPLPLHILAKELKKNSHNSIAAEKLMK
jgi:thiamine transporter